MPPDLAMWIGLGVRGRVRRGISTLPRFEARVLGLLRARWTSPPSWGRPGLGLSPPPVRAGVLLTRVLGRVVFSRPEKCIHGMREPWLSDSLNRHFREGARHISAVPRTPVRKAPGKGIPEGVPRPGPVKDGKRQEWRQFLIPHQGNNMNTFCYFDTESTTVFIPGSWRGRRQSGTGPRDRLEVGAAKALAKMLATNQAHPSW